MLRVKRYKYSHNERKRHRVNQKKEKKKTITNREWRVGNWSEMKNKTKIWKTHSFPLDSIRVVVLFSFCHLNHQHHLSNLNASTSIPKMFFFLLVFKSFIFFCCYLLIFEFVLFFVLRFCTRTQSHATKLLNYVIIVIDFI